MKKIETQIDIEATLNDLWDIFSDFKHYSEWNPFLIDVRGVLVEGSSVKIKARFSSGKIRGAEPKVEKLVWGKEVCFLARKGLLFTGRHYFIFEQISPVKTRLTHGEFFSGLLPFILWHKMEPTIRASFIEMNHALKLKAES